MPNSFFYLPESRERAVFSEPCRASVPKYALAYLHAPQFVSEDLRMSRVIDKFARRAEKKISQIILADATDGVQTAPVFAGSN